MKYIYLDKPDFNNETEVLSPHYYIEDGTFYAGWKVAPKSDEDGYTPTPDEQPADAPTLRSRVDALEGVTDDIVLMMADFIGGN